MELGLLLTQETVDNSIIILKGLNKIVSIMYLSNTRADH